MMKYLEFYKLLNENQMINPIWELVLKMIEIDLKENPNKDEVLSLISIYFSLVDDGNVCMSLKEDILSNKWNKKIEDTFILINENENANTEDFAFIRKESNLLIKNHLPLFKQKELSSIVGDNKYFIIDEDYLYLHKYYVSRNNIRSSMNRLFVKNKNATFSINYKEWIKEDGFPLSAGQEEAVKRGANSSLIITGGPGTGKTTSILYLLIGLLMKDINKNIYLVAPSGKASSRMKESITGGFNNLRQDFIDKNKDIFNRIKDLEEYTIHRLLSIDFNTQAFRYNKDNQFNSDSIFVIDESSMIDICVFDNLLSAIPNGANVYIMGDKNQLPSVDSGAVLNSLLDKPSLKDFIVELDQSNRFKEDTHIYALAAAINSGSDLPVKADDFKDYELFKIEEDNPKKPIYYYLDNKEGVKQKDIIYSVCEKWGKQYFSLLQDECSSIEPLEKVKLDNIFKHIEISRILCAQNQGVRGITEINKYIVSKFIKRDKISPFGGFYPGEIMMINTNNKALDLYNGDSGVLVSFKDDKTLYFMVKKVSKIIEKEGKIKDRIFKIGEYMFYPLRLIAKDEIDLAYAITIHKSQGSDYPNILVILPATKGNPLLNRQIVYTAITRTKGNTYLLTNLDCLEEAKNKVLVRDTNI